MKKICISISFLAVLFSCSKEEAKVNPETTNDVPDAPQLIFPSDGLQCTEANLKFSWNKAGGTDVAALTYLLEVATEENFTAPEVTESVNGTETTLALENGTSYFWRVKTVTEANGSSSFSEARSFQTRALVTSNSAPYAPLMISPNLGSFETGSVTTLSWSGSDADEDTLLYDVYFGTENPPSILAEDISGTSLEVNTSSKGTYYWRVAAKDDKNAVALSQVRDFKIE